MNRRHRQQESGSTATGSSTTTGGSALHSLSSMFHGASKRENMKTAAGKDLRVPPPQPPPPRSATGSSAASALDDPVDNVLRGNFQQTLPQPRARVVRIFIASSSAAEFEHERGHFWREIVPELQQYCLQFGAELFVVDPFQLGDGDLANDPHRLQNFVEQIHKCHDESIGPFFLCLLGDKYGNAVLPTTIKSDEFNHIRAAVFDASKDVRLLDEWYKLDNNATPSCFVLQKTSGKKKLDEKQRKVLLDLVQHGAQQAYHDGLINQVNQKQQERFFLSPLETMVQAALSFNYAERGMFVLLRKIEGSRLKRSDPKFAPFTDPPMGNNGSNHGGQKPSERLATLKNQLTSKLDKNNCETVAVSWPDKTDAAAWLQSKEMERYLNAISQQATFKMKQLISSAFASLSSPVPDCALGDWAYDEASTHLNFALQRRPNSFVGHAPLLAKLKDACRSAHKKGVLIAIRGEECSGRTALLCELTHLARSWLSAGLVVVPRFVGLSPKSVFAHELWRGICAQVAICYGLDEATSNALTATELRASLARCLEAVSASKKPLILLVDDVHLLKLARSLGQFGADFLPNPLPKNVIIVATYLGSLASSNSLVWLTAANSPNSTKDSSSITLTVPELNEEELMEIVKGLLATRHRKLAIDQLAVIKQKVAAASNPFVAALLSHDALQLASYQSWPSPGKPLPNSAESSTAKSAAAVVELKLNQLENSFGTDMVSCICQYLSVTSHGLTETELQDLLCCNRPLMQSIRQASSNTFGFPSEISLTILRAMEPLLRQYIVNGRRLIHWGHQCVANAARHKYLQNSADIKRCHSAIADLYNDVWTDLGLSLSLGSINEETGNETPRMVAKLARFPIAPQPLRSFALPGEQSVYNLRRVANLWFHLLHAGDVDNLKEQALCSFPYLNAVLQSFGLSHLLAVFEDTLQQLLHHDLQILYDQVIYPSIGALRTAYEQLGSEVIGRLRYTRAQNSTFLNALVEQAMAWVDNYTKEPLLVPLSCWIRPPKVQQVSAFPLKDWAITKTFVQPTLNHQHLLVAGNGGSPGTIYMYHIASQTMVRSFLGHTDRVTSLTLASTGQFFVSTSVDKSVRTWDLIQGQCTRNLCLHSDKVLCAVLTSDDQHVVTGAADSTAKVISLESGRVMRSLKDHTGPVVSLALTSSDEFLVTGSGDFVVMVWFLETGVLINRLGGLMAPVTCMTLTSNDAFLVVSCEDETLRVFSLCSGTELHELQGHEGKVQTMAASGDDCQLFAGCTDGRIYAFDIHNGAVLDVFECAKLHPVTSLRVTSDNRFLLSGNGDRIHTWNVDQSSYEARHSAPSLDSIDVCAVAVSRDQRYAACGTENGAVALWDLELCQCVWTTVHDSQKPVTCLQFNSESTKVLSGSTEGNISVWEMGNGELVRDFLEHQSAIKSIQLTTDGHRILSLDSDDVMYIWQMFLPEETESEPAILCKGMRDFMKLCPNDRDVLAKTSENPKEIKIWTLLDEGLVTRTKIGHNDEICCVGLSRNGRTLVTGSVDQSLKVWDVENGFLTQVLVGHEGSITACAVADDERLVVSAAEDQRVALWEVETGEELHSLTRHGDARVNAVALSSDATVALSGDSRGRIYAWDTESGEPLCTLSAHRQIVELLCSYDANRIVLRLDSCPHLPILCLHNTPAGLLLANSADRRRSTRAQSVSSVGSNASVSSGHGTLPAAAQPTSSSGSRGVAPPAQLLEAGSKKSHKAPVKVLSQHQMRAPSKVFDRLERNRSRASMYNADLPTTLTTRLVGERSTYQQGGMKGGRKSTVCAIL